MLCMYIGKRSSVYVSITRHVCHTWNMTHTYWVTKIIFVPVHTYFLTVCIHYKTCLPYMKHQTHLLSDQNHICVSTHLLTYSMYLLRDTFAIHETWRTLALWSKSYLCQYTLTSLQHVSITRLPYVKHNAHWLSDQDHIYVRTHWLTYVQYVSITRHVCHTWNMTHTCFVTNSTFMYVHTDFLTYSMYLLRDTFAIRETWRTLTWWPNTCM